VFIVMLMVSIEYVVEWLLMKYVCYFKYIYGIW
jgi:hypothetical protein